MRDKKIIDFEQIELEEIDYSGLCRDEAIKLSLQTAKKRGQKGITFFSKKVLSELFL